MSSESHLPQIDVSADRPTRPNAIGWLTSLCLHLLLLLIVGLLVAPANLSGLNTLIISISSSEVESEELTLCCIDTVHADLELPSAPATPLATPVLSEFKKTTATTHGGGGGGGGKGDGTGVGGSRGGDSSLRGSFFGIEAYGHEFVYVVDMSGSMEGDLYQRAIAELIRSVEQLSPSQKFYVTLFSDHAKGMFDDKSVIPKPIPATDENRERLAEWLIEAYDGGGTDPRRAVKLALDMNPSAIFMLSDGQFKENKRNQDGLFAVNNPTTTTGMVRSVSASIPIHGIAFENKESCESMQELAELTNGEYRFIPAAQQSIKLEDAIIAIEHSTEQGHYCIAQLLFDEMLHSIRINELDEKQHARLGKMMAFRRERALQIGGVKELSKTLKSLLTMDPDGVLFFDDQIRLVAAIRETSNATTDYLLVQADLLRLFGSSRLCQELQQDMLQQLTDEMDRIPKPSDLMLPTEIANAFQLYRSLVTLPGGDQLQKDMLERQRQIVSNQVAIATEKEARGGTIAFVRHLLDVFAITNRDWLRLGGEEALRNAAMRMQAQLRDNTSDRNVGNRLRLKEEIGLACQQSPEFARASAEFIRQDRVATGLYNRARREELKGNKRLAVMNYENIVHKHPYARVINAARTRLAELNGKPVEDTENPTLDIQPDSAFLDLFNEIASNENAPNDLATETEAERTPIRKELQAEARVAEPVQETVDMDNFENLIEAFR